MKIKLIFALVVVFALILCTVSVQAQSLTPTAKSAIIIDAKTGCVLYEKNADARMGMASTTKIMTAIVALENSSLDDVVTASENAAGTEGSSIYLSAGEQITMRDLLYGLMLSSGNDAAIAIAEHVGGSVEGFAHLMNSTAQKIGANNTQFKNPNGLDAEGHYTTARDLAKIAAYAKNNPTFCEIVKTKSATIPHPGHDYDRTLTNHNKLLTMYDGADGIKTGYTKSTGRSLVSSAERDGFSVVAVTLNCPDDWTEHINMFNYAFENYESAPVLTPGRNLGNFSVSGGTKEYVAYTVLEEYEVHTKRGEAPNVTVDCIENESLTAPITRGEVIGRAVVRMGDKVLFETDLFALSGVEKTQEKEFMDYLKLFVTELVCIMR